MNFNALVNAVINLKQDFDKADLLTVKISQRYPNGQTLKEYVHKCNGLSFECVLYVLNEFTETTGLLNYDIGVELFPNFRKVLTDHARDEWDNIVVSIPEADRDPDTFWTTIELWKVPLGSDSAKQYFVDYFLQLTKPQAMEVWAFGQRVLTLSRYIDYFPGPAEIMVTPAAVKNVIFKGMSIAWQTRFLCSNQSDVTAAIPQILQFMSNEKSFSDTNPNKRKSESNDYHSPQPGRGRYGNRNGRGGRGSGSFGNRGSRPGKRSSGRFSDGQLSCG